MEDFWLVNVSVHVHQVQAHHHHHHHDHHHHHHHHQDLEVLNSLYLEVWDTCRGGLVLSLASQDLTITIPSNLNWEVLTYLDLECQSERFGVDFSPVRLNPNSQYMTKTMWYRLWCSIFILWIKSSTMVLGHRLDVDVDFLFRTRCFTCIKRSQEWLIQYHIAVHNIFVYKTCEKSGTKHNLMAALQQLLKLLHISFICTCCLDLRHVQLRNHRHQDKRRPQSLVVVAWSCG